MQRRPYLAFLLVAAIAVIALPVEAQTCQACGYNGIDLPQCYSVPIGVGGNTGCANLYLGGCAYWGDACSSAQQGPPTLQDFCVFNWADPACSQPYQQYPMVCLPTMKNELLRYTPLPGQSIRVLRIRNGGLVRFEHAL